MPNQPWYMNAIFYEAPVKAILDSNGDGKGDLAGLAQKLNYFADLGVDCLWLNPIYPSPLKDDGYDISDYCAIHPDYGSLEDFKRLLEGVHKKGLRLILDLVVNHTSDQHPWFQAARSSRASLYRDYYVWSDNDQKYASARIIFVDTEKSNWTWDPLARQYFWHRFYSHQPDLNFDNPAVRYEMLSVMKFWLDLGIDGFRVDAVPYLFEREGTSCENLPETHVFLKEMRAFVEAKYPGRILLCEANQWPQDVRAYFGRLKAGEAGEFHMAFHFPLMPRLFMALRQHDASPIRWVLDNTPSIPDSAQWCTFLRNHDELTLEMVTEEERQWMWREYAPDPRMRLNLGIRRRLAPLLDNDRRQIELANALLFSLPGAPIIYYGDEIGMGDNIWLPDRDGVRTPMQWEDRPSAGFSNSAHPYSPLIAQPPFDYHVVNVAAQRNDPDSLWYAMQDLIRLRKSHPVLAAGELTWIETGKQEVLAFERRNQEERLLVVHNLSPEAQHVEMDVEGERQVWKDLLSGKVYPGRDVVDHQPEKKPPTRVSLGLELSPCQYLWLK
ncbi:MAG: maltose alpha-D-glucosyltransferase [Anaerolineales bacterium]|nr:MAG: maltose alpha-D-glucosyltransferase [Anaerolineales bacterium]